MRNADHWNRDHQWRYISYVCNQIRAGKADETDWAFLRHYASPELVQSMIKWVCLHKVGAA